MAEEHLTYFINLKDNFAQRFIHKGAGPNKRVTIGLQQERWFQKLLLLLYQCVPYILKKKDLFLLLFLKWLSEYAERIRKKHKGKKHKSKHSIHGRRTLNILCRRI